MVRWDPPQALPIPANPRAGSLTRALWALLVLVIGMMALAAPRAMAAPDITLSLDSPSSVLYGTEAAVEMRATNPAGQPTGYNLSFRAVLPAGVTYVPGSAGTVAGDPIILVNQPATGQRTLLWENVSDLTPNSSYAVSFRVAHAIASFEVGDSFTINGGAYINSDPRYVPDFDPVSGVPVAGATSYTGSQTGSDTTQIAAIKVDKAEPSPEGEILRGLHDKVTTYTLKVTNNQVRATNGITLVDYVPAGLEFLGCGNVDNTTNAPTNPGNAVEYPGAPAISGADPGNCDTPTSVETVNTDPDGAGPMPAGVYTKVTWTVPDRAPGTDHTIKYLAAIPIRENTMTWTAGPGTAASRTQAANLNNNSGPETEDEQTLRNYARADGTYQRPVASGGPMATNADTILTRTAEDLRLLKSVDSGVLSVGSKRLWTLTIDTSEYRTASAIAVTDTVPNGLCPLEGATEMDPGNPGECVGTGGAVPVGDQPSPGYAAPPAENSNGTWTVTWTVPAMAKSSTTVIRYRTKTRTHYQSSGAATTPVLAFDSVRNAVTLTGTTNVICDNADPNCAGGSPVRIDHDGPNSVSDIDASQAGMTSSGPTLDKRVGDPATGSGGSDCAAVTYINTVANSYGPGDKVCWRLTATFPVGTDTGSVQISDFIPPGTVYVAGSATVTGADNIAATIDTSQAADGVIRWNLGTVNNATVAKTFEVTFATRIKSDPSLGSNFDLKQNLMKMTSANTAGVSNPLRDLADFTWSEPVVGITKGVYQVDGAPAGGNAANTDGSSVYGGSVVRYRLDVKNTGGRAASAIEVWDQLPSQFTSCAAVASISDFGACSVVGGTVFVKWTGLAAAKSGDLGDVKTVYYSLTIPASLNPGTTLTNNSGIRTFQSVDNLGDIIQYCPTASATAPVFPSADIPGICPAANAPTAKDSSNVVVKDFTFTKTRTTSVNETGNDPNTQATIGETISYTVSFTVPSGTTMDSAVLSDPLGTKQTYVASSAAASWTDNGVAQGSLPVGMSLSDSSNTITLTFPTTYTNPAGSGDDVFTITFDAKVNDIAANLRGGAITNKAVVDWKDLSNTDRQSTTSTISTTIVEPNLTITKDENDADDIVAPGDVLRYTVTATNTNASLTNVSTAHNVAIVDTIPAGFEPLNAPGVPATDGQTVTPDGGVWNATNRTITWNVTSIAPGANTAKQYDVRVADGLISKASLENSVTVTGTSMPGSVTGERDGTTMVAGYKATTTDSVAVVSATLAKTRTPASAAVGAEVDYLLTLTLPAKVAYHDLTVIDTLPDGIDFDGELSAVCTLGCGPTPASTLLPRVANADGSTTVGWFMGDLAAHSSSRTFEITYRTHIDDTYQPEGTAVVSGDVLTNSASLYWNVANTITGTPTSVPAAGDFTKKDGPRTTNVTVQAPAITLDKNVSGDPGNTDTRATVPGDTYTYTITVKNTGNANAYDVRVTDTPATGIVNVANAAGNSTTWNTKAWSASDRSMAWVIPGPIAPNSSETVTYTAALAPSAQLRPGNLTNTADARYYGASSATRTANPGIDYPNYDDVTPDTVTLKLDMPALSVVKTTGAVGYPDSSPAEVNQPFTWRVVVTNTGTGDAKNVDVTDTLPAGWRYVPGTATRAPGGAMEPTVDNSGGRSRLTWNNAVATLAPNATLTVTFQARISATAALANGAGNHVNDVTATAEDTSGATASADGDYRGSDTATAVLSVPQLAISKTPDGDQVPAGQDGQYRVVVVNTGSVTARNVTITDDLPADVTYTPGTAAGAGLTEVSVTPNTPAAGRTRVVWRLTSLDPGRQTTILIPVRVANGLANNTTLTNEASVVSDEVATPVSDTGYLVVDSAPVWVTSSTKTGNPTHGTQVVPGDEITYTIRYQNTGNENATNVVVDDPIPYGATYVAGSATSTPAVAVRYLVNDDYVTTEPSDLTTVDSVRFLVGAVNVGTSGSVSVRYRVNKPLPNGTLIANIADITSDQTPDGTGVGPVVNPVKSAPILDLVKKADFTSLDVNASGNRLTYTLTLTNSGDENALDAVIEDSPPTGTTVVATEAGGTTVTCATEAQAPYTFGACPRDYVGVTRVRWTAAEATIFTPVVVKMTVAFPIASRAQKATLTNTAQVSSRQTSVKPSNTIQAEVTTAPRLTLAKTVTPGGAVTPGTRLTYGLTFANSGSADAQGTVLTDAIPANTTYAAGSASSGAQFLVNGAYQASEPANPADVKGLRWELGVLARDAQGAKAFSVTVNSLLDNGTRIPNTASLEATSLAPVTASVSNEVSSAPRVVISKTALTPTASVGGQVLYRLRVAVEGDNIAKSVVVTDQLPVGLAYVKSTGMKPTVNGRTITWNLGDQKPGYVTEMVLTTRVTEAASGARELVNTLAASVANGEDPTVAATVVGPAAGPRMTLVKSGPRGGVGGRPIPWTLSVRNSGATTLNGVAVTDVLPSGMQVVRSSRPYRMVKGRVVFRVGTLRPGQSVSINLVTLMPRSTRGRVTNRASASGVQVRAVRASATIRVVPLPGRVLPGVTG